MNTSTATPTTVLKNVPLEELTPHPDNYRRHDLEGIKDSLKRFGQARPILANPQGVILAGNGTYESIRQLGWETIDVIYAPFDEETSLAYLVADNRAGDKATNNDEQLVKVLNTLADKGQLGGVGFTPDEIDDLTSAIEAVPDMPREEFTGGYAEDPTETAARWEDRNEGQRREVVFLLLEEDFNQFRSLVEDLKGIWGKESMAETILEAVKYAHRTQGELAS